MYYAMTLTEGCATRVGRMTPNPIVAQRAAERANGYVEEYQRGVVWTRAQGWRDGQVPVVGAVRS